MDCSNSVCPVRGTNERSGRELDGSIMNGHGPSCSKQTIEGQR